MEPSATLLKSAVRRCATTTRRPAPPILLPWPSAYVPVIRPKARTYATADHCTRPTPLLPKTATPSRPISSSAATPASVSGTTSSTSHALSRLRPTRRNKTRIHDERGASTAKFSSMPVPDDDHEWGTEEDRHNDSHRRYDRDGDNPVLFTFSVHPSEKPDKITKHCPTCACDHHHQQQQQQQQPHEDSLDGHENSSMSPFACGSPQHEDDVNTLPPPLPDPSYSVYMRIMPPTLVPLRSPAGKTYLQEALAADTAEHYLALMEQFMNQSDPAFCGVTTLCMVLNAMGVDPNVRWRGGWRWYGSEDMLLDRCCMSTERIRRVGITVEEFQQLGRCQGLSIELRRPQTSDDTSETYSVQDFRDDVLQSLSGADTNSSSISPSSQQRPMIVTSFSRVALGQTGDGHFSPLAAYHAETDSVLVLDVARFKYAPYWVKVDDLYRSMEPPDITTQKPRGWFRMRYRKRNNETKDMRTDVTIEEQERRRPADIVPALGQGDACPVGPVKIEFCTANPKSNRK